jgi:lysophospholipase L1-like esterase
MIFQRFKSLLRSIAVTTSVSIGIILCVELAGWLLKPDRYENPPAVTADAWISSDALAPGDTVWLKEFVDEFCRSYTAHWTSYVYFKRNPFSGKHINVDTNGIRRTAQFALRKTSDVRPMRVFLIGGSTMWGTGARDSGTIASALSRTIASDTTFGSTEVVNLGESGYVSTQSVIRLELELRKGNIPDIVILYDGVNDVFAAYQNLQPGLPQNETHRATEFNLLKERGRMRRIWLDSLISRTFTAGVVQSLRAMISSPPPPAPPHIELAPEIVRLYRENLKIVEALAKQYGFIYEAYWQPVVFTKRSFSPYEQKQADLVGYARPLFQEVYSQVREDADLRDYKHFHNISTIFDTIGTPVYLDFCHITESGNSVVARQMHADMKSDRAQLSRH